MVSAVDKMEGTSMGQAEKELDEGLITRKMQRRSSTDRMKEKTKGAKKGKDKKPEETKGEDEIVVKEQQEEEKVVEKTENVEQQESQQTCGEETDKPKEEELVKLKGILKKERTWSNKKVIFNEAVDYIRPYDPEKDFTVEIQFVKEMPKKVVSYSALIAQMSAQREAEEAAERAADEAAEKAAAQAVKVAKMKKKVPPSKK